MMPNEAQEAAAKVLFIVFATLMICLTKVNAQALAPSEANLSHQIITKSN